MTQMNDRIEKYCHDTFNISQFLRDYKDWMTTEDYDFLEDKSEDAHPLVAPEDYEIRVSERVRTLTRSDLWLGDNDNDWHLPLLITIREKAARNYRQRSSAGWEKRQKAKEKFKQKLEEKKKQKELKGKGKEQDHYCSKCSKLYFPKDDRTAFHGANCHACHKPFCNNCLTHHSV